MLKTNIFISATTPFAVQKVYQYSMLHENIAYGERMAYANRLTNQSQLVIPTEMGLIATKELDLDPQDYKFDQDLMLSARDDLGIMKRLAEAWFRDLCRWSGYSLQEQGMVFTEKFQRKAKIRLYEGFKYAVTVLHTGHVAITIDPKVRYYQELSQFLRNNTGFLVNPEPIRVRVPSGSSFKWISGTYIEPAEQLASDPVIGKDLSYVDYWKTGKKANFCDLWSLDIPEDDPVHKIEVIKGKSFSYPQSVIRISIDLTRLGQRPGSIPTPKSRMEQFQRIASELFGSVPRNDSLNFEFDLTSVDKQSLTRFGYQFGKLDRPTLAYAKNSMQLHETRTPTKDSDVVANLKTFGPYSGSVHAVADTIVITGDSKEAAAKKGMMSYVGLTTTYSKCNLGTLKKGAIKVIPYQNKAQLRSDLKSFSPSPVDDGQRRFVICLLDLDETRDAYIQAKRVMTELGLPSKMLEGRSIGILNGTNSKTKTSTAQIIALQIYARLLHPGEAAILLANQSKGLPLNTTPVILTMDISRDERYDEYGVAEVTAFDGRGLLLSATSKRRFKEKEFNENRVVDWFIESVHDAADLSDRLGYNQPNAFMFMYDGALNPVQVQVLQKAAGEALRQMVAAKILPKGSRYAMIEVTKNVPERLFSDLGKPNIGTYMVDPLQRGYLVASKPYRGSPKLLRCSIRAQSSGFLTSQDLLKFVHDLRHLTPSSPWTQPRDPVPKYLAHNNSNLSRMGIDPPYIPF